jgi:hypothetical protein
VISTALICLALVVRALYRFRRHEDKHGRPT